DGKVVVLSGDPDGGAGQTVLAYDKITGERAWTALNEKLAYASPMLVTLAGERQLLIVASKRVVGLKPDGTRQLWEIPWLVQYDNGIAQPVLVSSNRFLLSAGYG